MAAAHSWLAMVALQAAGEVSLHSRRQTAACLRMLHHHIQPLQQQCQLSRVHWLLLKCQLQLASP